jgi:hypothetical protein
VKFAVEMLMMVMKNVPERDTDPLVKLIFSGLVVSSFVVSAVPVESRILGTNTILLLGADESSNETVK